VAHNLLLVMQPATHLRALALLMAASLPGAVAAAGPAPTNGYAVYESDSSFEDVLDGLKLAIQERGMYINNVMHMGDMLTRTGKDLGTDETLYTHAQSVEFCSAVLSRKMLAEAPARIVNCPFIIAVYTLPDDPGTTYVVHRQIPRTEIESSAVMHEIADMLKDVASSAVSW
jgi:uncharacterized protein (DUF302 family)